ncbi:MAG: UDP-glucose 4-epimerase family protein [Gemmatimonadaceae bacterium]
MTGAAGFVGSALITRLIASGTHTVRAVVRSESRALPPNIERAVRDVGPQTDWVPVVRGIDTVVHLAARVHKMRDTASDPLAEFRYVNTSGTLNLARHAVAANVRRFVFLSSIKVNGETGSFREADAAAPADAYGLSKYEAEQGLKAIAAETGMAAVIIRSPLVYGPGVQANLRALMRAIALGIPLPLGAVDNRRSLVALDNLVDLIVTCMEHPAAANETFFVSDGEDLSTPQLIRRLARAMGRPARLIPVPPAALTIGATLLGKSAVAQRLLGSLQVDISKTRQLLGWSPPVNVDEGLTRAVASR